MSLLTDREIADIATSTQTAEPGRDGFVLPNSFARAIEAAVIKKLATVSVEPKPVNESGTTMTITRWMAETQAGWIGSWDKDAIPTALAAARVQAIEEAARVCDTHTVDDVLVGVGISKSCASMIRALIGGAT